MDVPSEAPRRRRPSRLKRRLLLGGVVTPLSLVFFYAMLEGALMLAGVEPAASGDDPYVGFSNDPVFVADNAGMLVTADAKLSNFNAQTFPSDKPPGVTRIFCLGGSTTFGRPYDDRTSFCGWLRALLDRASPGEYEVINAGGVSYASYRVSRVLDEVLKHDADIVIVYTGHNEFLEDRTYAGLADTPAWVLSAASKLSHLRTFTVMRDAFAPPRPETITSEVSTRLDVIGPEDYERDDVHRASVLRHLRFNLKRMATRAADAGARLVFVTPAGQLRNCTPFSSRPDETLTPDEHARAAELRAFAGRAEGDDRVEAWRAAVKADPRVAGAHYALGEALFARGEFDAARAAYTRARDEDICPLRAVSGVPELVREAARDAGVLLVDYAQLIDNESRVTGGHGIPGRDLFFDHVHPTIDMHWLLGQTLFEQLALTPTLDAATRDALFAEVTNGLDTRDHVVALRNLAKVLGWSGKRAEAAALAADASALAGGGDSESHFLTGTFALQDGRPAEAIAPLQQALEIDPDYAEASYNLGEAFAALGRFAEALPHFERSASLNPDKRSATNNLALMHLRLDDAPRALQLLDALIARAPDYARAHYNRGTALARLRRLAEAETAYARAADADPSYAKPHASLGILLAAQRRHDEAITAFEASIARDASVADVHRRLGEALLAAGRPADAVTALEDAAHLAPDDERIPPLLQRARGR